MDFLPINVRLRGRPVTLVGAGVVDATWTLWPKSEWDVAAGAALVAASGGSCWLPGGAELLFNREDPRIAGFYAAAAAVGQRVHELTD